MGEKLRLKNLIITKQKDGVLWRNLWVMTLESDESKVVKGMKETTNNFGC